MWLFFPFFIWPVGDRDVNLRLLGFCFLICFREYPPMTWFTFFILDYFLGRFLFFHLIDLRSNILLFKIIRFFVYIGQLLLLKRHDLMNESFLDFNFLDVFRKLVIHLIDWNRLLLEPWFCVFVLFFTLAELQTIVEPPTVKLSVHETYRSSMV